MNCSLGVSYTAVELQFLLYICLLNRVLYYKRQSSRVQLQCCKIHGLYSTDVVELCNVLHRSWLCNAGSLFLFCDYRTTVVFEIRAVLHNSQFICSLPSHVLRLIEWAMPANYSKTAICSVGAVVFSCALYQSLYKSRKAPHKLWLLQSITQSLFDFTAEIVVRGCKFFRQPLLRGRLWK